MVHVGFEPTPPKRLELESSALDRSASEPSHQHSNIVLIYSDHECKNDTKKPPTGFEPMTSRLLSECSTN
jgi:hypothetical protein